MMLPLVICVAMVLLLVVPGVFVINEQELGLVTQFGRPVVTIKTPGLYFRIPGLHSVHRMDKRMLIATAPTAEYLTADKKRVLVEHVSRWRIVDPLTFYQTVHDEAGAVTRLHDIIIARLRQEIARRSFMDIVRKPREEIMRTVTKSAEEIASSFGIGQIDVRLTRVDLPAEVQASVFARMYAERERVAKGYRAEGEEQAREIRAQADRERDILLAKAYEESQRLTGEGEASATAVYAEAYGRDPEFYAFIGRLQTYEKALAQDATLVLGSESDLLRYLENPTRRDDTKTEEVQKEVTATPKEEQRRAVAPR
ncbi:MAG: protease modulator HflC [Candidatus Binatia bacterium]